MGMKNLRVEVTTPVGIFEGRVNGEPASEEDLISTRNALQQKISSFSYLVIYADDAAGSEITFPDELIKRSVFIFKIVD